MFKLFSCFLDKLSNIVVFFASRLLGNLLNIDYQYVRELTRYFVVGVLVTLGYTFTVIALVDLFKFTTPVIANTLGFFIWAPASFLGHKEFTFHYSGELRASLFKFFLVFGAKLLASTLVIIVMQVYGYSYIFGVLANWFFIPLAAFLILKIWVFEDA